jgi:hypothetical protein
MIEIVCDGMNATKSYTREVVDVKSATQISKRHIGNDPDHWVVIRNAVRSYMIMQEGAAQYGVYDMATGESISTIDDLAKAIELCWKKIST